MLKEKMTSQDVRQVVLDFMSLPETEFMVVAEVITDFKRQAQAKAERRTQAAELVARAKQRAAELKHLSREELGRQFMQTVEAVRAEAIAHNTASDSEAEWVRDD